MLLSAAWKQSLISPECIGIVVIMVNILVKMPGRCSTPGAPRKEEQVPVSYHRAWSTPWSLWWLLQLWRGRDAISFNYSEMSIFTWSSPRSAHTTAPGKQQWVGRWNRPRWDLDEAWIIIIIILLSWWYYYEQCKWTRPGVGNLWYVFNEMVILTQRCWRAPSLQL